MRTTAVAILISMLGGCATTLDPNYVIALESYRLTISSQREVEVAKARAEEARYVAMAQIAERADPQSKQMALLALALGGRVEVSTRPESVVLPRLPESAEDRALRWAAVIVPSAANIALAGFSYSLGKTQSNNATTSTVASYNALLGMKPAPIDFTKIPPTTVTTINNTTNADVANKDGLVVVGAQPTATQDNSPVTPIVPVVVVPTSGIPTFGPL
jgi:hypothetical protein